MIKGDTMTAADGVGTMTIAAEVEAEVEAGITMITASLWIRVGLDLGIEEAGMDHQESEEVGLKKFHYLYDKFTLMHLLLLLFD
jgi:hypothetical protein